MNLFILLTSNMISRHEITRKHSRSLSEKDVIRVPAVANQGAANTDYSASAGRQV